MSGYEYWDIETGEGLSDEKLHEWYDDLLDDNPEFRIGDLTYSASRVLKSVNPIAYRCGFNDWLDTFESITDEEPLDDEEE